MQPLKPCPFCGGTPIRCGGNEYNSNHWILCQECHVSPYGAVPFLCDAETTWNTRPAAPAEGLETVKKSLLDAVDAFDNWPPSAQTMANIRVVESAHKYIEQAEADNAALTARVSMQDREISDQSDLISTLETQLAAARKALEEIAHPKALTSLSKDKARAALEAKP